ncbi:MAG: ion channel [Pseudolabrys sp.]|nr:ion channel [Pseudolabrys sp.]
MWSLLLSGAAVSLVNFAIHALMTGLIVLATRHTSRVTGEMHMLIRLTSLLLVTLSVLMCAHVIEIAVWTFYYFLIDLKVVHGSNFEFAFENYTALGYGDALPADINKRLVGPITSLNGVLLIGWSVAVIFEVMRMAELQFGHVRKRAN